MDKRKATSLVLSTFVEWTGKKKRQKDKEEKKVENDTKEKNKRGK